MIERIEEYIVGELVCLFGISVCMLYYYDVVGLLWLCYVIIVGYCFYGWVEVERL